VPTDPINLSEAAADLASGVFGDLDADEILLEFAPILQPPYLLAGLGLAMGVLCGLTFARLVQNRLEGWKQDRLAMLPLGNGVTTLPYIGVVLGITLFIGGSLQVFGFSAGAALLVSFVLSIATAGALWVQLERLMAQVQDGTFSAVDFDNFDQFF
jgi:cytochrome bd-type quinol oxidase subunit 2